MRSQHTRSAVDRLNALLRRMAVALERHNHERENDRLAGLVQDAMNERGNT